MNPARVISSAFLVAALAATASASDYPLPSWGDGERARMEKEGWLAGADLLTDGSKPDGDESAAGEADPELEASGLDSIEPAPDELATPSTPPSEVPEKFWADYFAEKPKAFLVDPQKLLAATESADRLSFLNYHSSDSAIDLYAYIFKGDQEIPGEVREEELIERCFADGRPAAVVFYFMSSPQHSVLYLSPRLTDAISTAEQRRALEEATMQALSKNDPSAQLEGFLVQMSIRLYWMERRISGRDTVEPVAASTPVRPKKPEKKSHLSEAVMPWIERAKPLATQGALAAGCLMAVMLVVWVLRLRRTYRFPDFDVEPRLGGPHAAGVGAVISFATATLPPASQKDQMPDYLRRY